MFFFTLSHRAENLLTANHTTLSLSFRTPVKTSPLVMRFLTPLVLFATIVPGSFHTPGTVSAIPHGSHSPVYARDIRSRSPVMGHADADLSRRATPNPEQPPNPYSAPSTYTSSTGPISGVVLPHPPLWPFRSGGKPDAQNPYVWVDYPPPGKENQEPAAYMHFEYWPGREPHLIGLSSQSHWPSHYTSYALSHPPPSSQPPATPGQQSHEKPLHKVVGLWIMNHPTVPGY
ncbi:hypothetical protein BC835DRAFT_219583 [Cytidiella melzeri]|nr:hypothetical protein BC835DRAFT_219583 [Cytidiella melzeri]